MSTPRRQAFKATFMTTMEVRDSGAAEGPPVLLYAEIFFACDEGDQNRAAQRYARRLPDACQLDSVHQVTWSLPGGAVL